MLCACVMIMDVERKKCSVTCSVGTEQRQRRCSSVAHSWAECQGEHQERRGCSKPSCSGGVNWGSWNHWSLCSKTCDSGWQRRFRMCDGPLVQGSSCQGSGEEDRTCNHKKCPGRLPSLCYAFMCVFVWVVMNWTMSLLWWC
ncbi:hypothetical protein NHX12_023305 [Muraenolepis orangiensis]|uniref:Properdin n=1 Tax=Muraenolepis orangiensis TaxID=630683 RepID=A0A9Q0EJT0_9TELE|nr:hypothetical protein NHX12_023305 [Muraenolepis orangiensis]